MGPAMLLHVVLAGEGLVALRAEGILLARVLLSVAGGVARGGEVVAAVVLLGDGARVAVFLRALVRLRGGIEALGGWLGPKVAGLDGGCGVRKRPLGLGEGWVSQILLRGEEAVLVVDGRIEGLGRQAVEGELWGDGRGCLHGVSRVGRITAHELRRGRGANGRRGVAGGPRAQGWGEGR